MTKPLPLPPTSTTVAESEREQLHDQTLRFEHGKLKSRGAPIASNTGNTDGEPNRAIVGLITSGDEDEPDGPDEEPVYRFPAGPTFDRLLATFRTKDPKALAGWAVLEKSPGKPGTTVYRAIRERYCALNLVLNEQGLVAPAFRKIRAPHKHENLTDGEKLLALDRQVLDLHYLHCQHRPAMFPRDALAKEIFGNPDFDFAKASKLASYFARAAIKAERLRLTQAIQKELFTLRSEEVRNAWRRVNTGRERWHLALREWQSSSRSRLSPADIPERILELVALRLADGCPGLAVRYWQLAVGKRLGEQQVKNKRELLRKRKELFERVGVTDW